MTPALADDLITQSADGTIRLTGSVGSLNLSARELVVYKGARQSELDWTSSAVPAYTAGIAVTLDPDWTLGASLRYAHGGDSNMTDRDWIAPFATGTGDDDWSNRSLHPDTRLRDYINADLSITRSILKTESSTAGLTGGLRYTDVRWDAYGGSYVYSVSEPRDKVGNFPDGERGISYRQRIPVIYAGLTGETSVGDFSFTGGAKLGVTAGYEDIDEHWKRALHFNERLYPAPVALLSAAMSYAVSPRTQLTLGADFESVFSRHGDTRMTNELFRDSTLYKDVAAASFRSVQLSLGLKVRF